jgi:hypothetical protein
LSEALKNGREVKEREERREERKRMEERADARGDQETYNKAQRSQQILPPNVLGIRIAFGIRSRRWARMLWYH